ncbi:MAG: phosphatase PAP2 family protein [Verrucomicrobia bacterium]|nr:phosphatase PAP2 family protein [Verrucomicrobiota bacterium]
MPEDDTHNHGGVPARLVPYESRALTYRSDARKLTFAILITTAACGMLLALSLLVGEANVVEWARVSGGKDEGARGFATLLLRMPRYLMYAVFFLFFIIGRDRKQRVWMHIALIVLVLELVFAGGLVRILKFVVARARPQAPSGEPFSRWDNQYNSFPSGDAADIAASISFFLYFARRNAVRWLCLAGLGAVVFERMMNKCHYPSDLIAGAYLLFVISFIVWHWFVAGFPFRRIRGWLRQDEVPELEPEPALAADDEAGVAEDEA